MRKLLLSSILLLTLSACNKEPANIGAVPENYDLTSAIDSLPQEQESLMPERNSNESAEYEDIPYIPPSESYELVKAACDGNNQLVKEILEKDTSNINKESFVIELETVHNPLNCALTGTYKEGYTPQHKEVVKTLVAYGADVNKPDPSGQDPRYCTPLQLATFTNDLETVKLLLDNGAEINPKIRVINFYRKEADITLGYCEHSLDIAEKKGNPEITKLLLSVGADKNTKEKYSDLVFEHKIKGTYKEMESLIQAAKDKEDKSLAQKDIQGNGTYPRWWLEDLDRNLHSFAELHKVMKDAEDRWSKIEIPK